MKTPAMSIVIALVFVINGFAQERVRIRAALSPTGSYPILIAQEKGFFEKNGLKAEIIRIYSDATNSQVLISGDIDTASGVPTGPPLIDKNRFAYCQKAPLSGLFLFSEPPIIKRVVSMGGSTWHRLKR